MCKLRTCWCCLTLRTGCIMSAIYTIVLAALGIFSGIAAAVQAEKRDPGLGGKIAVYVLLVSYILWLIFGILLIFGVVKSRRGYLMPWIVMTSILTALSILAIIGGLVGFELFFKSPSAVFQFVLWILGIIINIMALMCVHSYYRWGCKEPGPAGTV